MPIPCTQCAKAKKGHSCILSRTEPNLSRCSNCVRRGRTCDAKPQMPSKVEWESIDRQKRKLEDEASEAMAKLLRIHKQKRLLEDKEKEMIRRGLRTLKDLDEAEAKDREMDESPNAEAGPVEDTISWPADGGQSLLSAEELQSVSWGDLGFLDGTVATPQGSS